MLMWDGKNPHFMDFGRGRDLRSKEESEDAPTWMLIDAMMAADLFKKHLTASDLVEGIDRYLDVLRRNLNPEEGARVLERFGKDVSLNTLRKSAGAE